MRQGSKHANEHVAQFDEYRMMCKFREDTTINLSRFQKGLNDDLRRKVILRGVSTLDGAYTLVQNYKFVMKSQWRRHQDTCSIPPKSKPCNNNFLLAAIPRKPNPTITRMLKEDKGKGILRETPKMT